MEFFADIISDVQDCYTEDYLQFFLLFVISEILPFFTIRRTVVGLLPLCFCFFVFLFLDYIYSGIAERIKSYFIY